MQIDYKLSKVVIKCFRGIDELTLDLRDGFPTVLIGTNNAGKSTILNAIALALNGGGFHQWSPEETDFYCNESGERASDFLVQVHFHSAQDLGYPAVRGVGKPTMIHGVQVKGTTSKDGKMSHRRMLFDETGKPATIAPRTALGAQDKVKFADHNIGFTQIYAKLDDIRDHAPETWLFKPQNIEASLYVWKTGPIAKLSKMLAMRFLSDEWELLIERDKSVRPMPKTMYRAYDFFRDALEQFPFWKQDMKPHLEEVIRRYVGRQAKIDLKPDTHLFEDWIAQQLAISLATDPDCATIPLRKMGDGWQAVIRLAALEALTKYPELTKERIVLLLEEPETHLHPHLRRKLRKVLAQLAAKGWTVVLSTHSQELVSFDEKQVITRLVRTAGKVVRGTVDTDEINADAKLQSKLDERGAHDFLFGTGVVFCEGKDDAFAVRLGFERVGADVDVDARSISIAQCGSVSAIPAFVQISKKLGIRWCALTDQDLLPDGGVKPSTERDRKKIDVHRGASDLQAQWPVDLEHCLKIDGGKATAVVVQKKLSEPAWQTEYSDFKATLAKIAKWIDCDLAI